MRRRPNETVEKPILGKAFPVQGPTMRPISRLVGSFSLCQGLDQCPVSVDLADIVNQSEQRPLYIHFPFRAQREAVHTLLHADVCKDRFHNAKSPGIDLLALFTIDLGLHLIDQVGGLALHLNGKIAAYRICLLQAA